jgi:hypothetical protein
MQGAGGCCIALSASAGRQDEYRRVYLGTSLGFALSSFGRSHRDLHSGLDFDRPIMPREYRRRSHHAPVRVAAAVQPQRGDDLAWTRGRKSAWRLWLG